MNRFSQALFSGRMITTAAYMPPAGSDPGAIKTFSSTLPPDLDAVVVADNPDRIRSSAFSAAALLHKEKKTSVILAMTTRDRNRIGLISDALGAAALDIEAILCVSGNHQAITICPQAAAANDIDSVQFIQAMKKMALFGDELNDKEAKPGLKLQVGATAHPSMRPLDLNLLRLKKKISVGADFLITQAVFDLKEFEEWMDAVRAAGLDKRTAIIASVLPLTSAEKAAALQQSRIYGSFEDAVIKRIGSAKDAVREGVSIASEIAIQLKEIPGVRGIHIHSDGCESLAAEVINQAGLQRKK
jgi:methylenetetrahydrofolate reductase (NADPH)